MNETLPILEKVIINVWNNSDKKKLQGKKTNEQYALAIGTNSSNLEHFL